MLTYVFGWTEVIFNTFFIFEILARLGQFESKWKMSCQKLQKSLYDISISHSKFDFHTLMKAISNSLRNYTRVYSNWIDICSVAPFCFDVIMEFFPSEFKLDNKVDLKFKGFGLRISETTQIKVLKNCDNCSSLSRFFHDSNHPSATSRPNA